MDFDKINNLCRVCFKNPTEIVSLNQTQIEKLSFIGDSSKIIRFKGQSPKLCTNCGTNLDSVYDFIFKLRTSATRMKHEEQAKDDRNHFNKDHTRRVISSPSPQCYEVTLPSGSFVINAVVDAEPNLAEIDVSQRQPESMVPSQSSQLNCDVECGEPKPVPESTTLTTSESKTVDELNSRRVNAVKSEDFSRPKRELQLENGFQSNSNDAEDSTNICEMCDVTFTSTSKMLRHVHEYSGPGFACPDQRCNFIFTQKSNLDKHIKSHEAIIPYSCQLGDKTFARRISNVDE